MATVLMEVLPPSTMAFDRFRKVEEYKTDESVKVVLLIASQSTETIVWRRGDLGWVSEIVETLNSTISFPEIGWELTLMEIYEDTEVDRTMTG